MKILNKLTYKNLLLNKKRSIVTIIGIILSVALLTAVSSMVVSFRESVIKLEKEANGNYHYSFMDVKESDLNQFKNNRYIESYYVTKDIGYAKIDSKNEFKPYVYVMEMDNVSLKNTGIVLISGNLPKNDEEILIPRHLKTNGRVEYNIGDSITLNIGERVSEGYSLNQNNPYDLETKEDIVNTNTKTYKVVGIMERVSNSMEPLSAPGYTLISYIGNTNRDNYNVYVRYTKEGLKKQYEVTANILDVDKSIFECGMKLDPSCDTEFKSLKYKFDFNTNYYLIKLETNSFSDETMKLLLVMASIVTVIIIVTSVFCIKNSFDISINERVKEYGILSSVGTTGKQIKRSVYYEAFLLGVIAIPLGILFGVLASYILILILNHFSNNTFLNTVDFFQFRISLIAILLSIVLSSIVIYFSSKKSARMSSKISPIEAIRGNKSIKINKKKIGCPRIIDKLFGIGGVISYKNIKRNKKKYRTTIISIIISVTVYIGLSYFVDTVFRVIKTKYGEYTYNISVVSYLDDYDESIKRMNEILKSDSIIDYSLVRESLYEGEVKRTKDSIKFESDINTVEVISVGKYEYLRYLDKLNLKYDDVKDKAILINNGIGYENGKNIIFSILDYKVGDKINLSNAIDKKDYSFLLASVTYERPKGYENDYGMPYIVVSDEVMDSISKRSYVSLYIESTNPDKLQDDIEKIFEDKDGLYNVNNIDSNIKQIKSIYTIVAIFLYGFIIVISLIGITNIFNTISTNMALRKNEFATLKSIGMTKIEFNRMIFLESFFYTIRSLIIGIPLGIGLSYLVHIGFLTGMEFNYELPIKGIIVSVIVVFILIFILNSYSSKKANKGNIIETIRNENI